jgi:hypothetical protein
MRNAGYVDRSLYPGAEKWYEATGRWYGTGSAYLSVGRIGGDGYEQEIVVRMSDHAPRASGGMRYSAATESFDRAGEPELSIHRGSDVTLRNIISAVTKKLEQA